MQENCLTEIPSGSLCPQDRQYSRASLCLSRCRLAKVQNYEFLSGTPACAKHFSSMWDQPWKVSRERGTSRPKKKQTRLCGHCSRIKQAKAQLAELDDSINGEAGTSKKSTKKSNVTTAEASPADPALQAELMSEIKQAQ